MYENNDGFMSGYFAGRDASNGYGYGYGNGFFGGDWAWILILLLLGWGNNGWGGNGFGCGNSQLGYDIGKLATTNDVAVGFNNSAVLNNLNDLKLGQAGIQQTLCQGFNGVNASISNLGFDLQNCCCQTLAAIQGVNYNLAKSTCDITNTINSSTRDIIDAQRDGTNAILNFLTQDKIATLQAENQSLKFQASQTAQNAYLTATIDAGNAELIRRLGRDCPVPAFVVPNPNCCCGANGYGYGYNNGCGCGC